MIEERYWVVGGDYNCLAFKTLRSGRPDVLGPFATREEARNAWRQVSTETRSRATTRYGIATERMIAPA